MYVSGPNVDMSTQPSTSTGRTVQQNQLAASAGLGVIAAAIGYLLTYLLVAGEVRDMAFSNVPNWKAVAWYFFNGHFVSVEAAGSVGGFGSSESFNFIAQSSTATASLVYLVPPIVLLGVGALLAHRFDAKNVSEAVYSGTPVVIGYGIVMAIGALVAEASTEASFIGIDVSGSIGPQLLPAILLAGIVYPLVFATAGAVLLVVVRST